MSDFCVPEIYWFFNTQITPSKKKCHVCVTEDEQFFLVNTDNRSIYDCVPILAVDYPFLKGQDRFISCSRLFKYVSLYCVDDIRCSLLLKDVLAIKKKVQTSYVLEQENIDKILRSLDGWIDKIHKCTPGKMK